MKAIYVGRLAPEKNLEELLRAVHGQEKIRLNLIGSGPLSRKLAASLPRNVAMIGEVANHDLPALLHSADVFVLPSREEFGGLALVEALSCGIPVVAFDGKATGEIVRDGINGISFGETRTLAEAVALASSSTILSNLSKNAKWDIGPEYWMAVAERLLGSGNCAERPGECRKFRVQSELDPGELKAY